VNVSANTFKLEWLDSFAPGTSYRVETQAADGSFTSVETLASAGGANAAMQWERAITVTTIYRVLALPSGRTVTLQTPAGQSSVAVTIAAAAAQIQVDKAEPLSGTALLSINAPVAYLSVQWFADLRVIGPGAATVGNGIAWDTSSQTNGSHLVLARVQTTADTYVELRRSVTVSNANLAMVATANGSLLKVYPTSDLGIRSVSVTLDGVPFGSLTVPNACSGRQCGGNLDAYEFNARGAASGTHTWVATATDTAGNTRQASASFTVSNPPTVVLTLPGFEKAFVSGNLRVKGLAATDKPGPLTVRASLGAVQFLQTTTAAFDTTFDLTGLPAGFYTLTIRVTDSTDVSEQLQRTVVVASSAALAYGPAQGLGSSGELLAVEGDRQLYSSTEVGVRLRDIAGNTDIALAGAQPNGLVSNRYSLNAGFAYSNQNQPDCSAFSSCIYQWAPDGSIRKLSTNEPVAYGSGVGLLARDGFVAWAGRNPGSPMTLLDLGQNRRLTIAPFLGDGAIRDFDFSVQAGTTRVFYSDFVGINGSRSAYDLFKWDSSTQVSTRMTTEGENLASPATDGVRVAWQRLLLTPPANGASTLFTESFAGGSRTTVSTTMDRFFLADGVLAWTEFIAPTARALKASVGGTTSVISSSTTTLLYATSGGFVVYGQGDKVYSWNSVTQKSTLRVDVTPTRLLLSGNRLYFVLGPQIYRVLLD
jgi:hypothetical protein